MPVSRVSTDSTAYTVSTVSTVFMILVDTSQTQKVKSKSVSDMDFPDQSQCTSLLDLTPIYVYSEGRSQKRKCRNQIFWIRITLARRVSDYLGDIKGCLSSLGCLRVYRRAQSMWASVWPKPIHHFGTSPTCNIFSPDSFETSKYQNLPMCHKQKLVHLW